MSPELCAEALFVSPLQCSWEPTAEQVGHAIEAMVLLYGTEEIVGAVAQEFGDHPQAAAERMRWCVDTVRQVFTMAGTR